MNSGTGQTCMVAVVLDNTVVSAPAIQAVLSTTSRDHRRLQQDLRAAAGQPAQVRRAAAHLRAAATLNSISATLGQDYLRAGLLAAGIGMLLVIVYAFFYYRLLGIGDLAEPAAVGPADLRHAGVPRPPDRLHADPGRHRRLHRVAGCRRRLVRHLLRTAQGRDTRGSKSAQRGARGPGSGPGGRSSPPTR